jgi:hypothetical protein
MYRVQCTVPFNKQITGKILVAMFVEREYFASLLLSSRNRVNIVLLRIVWGDNGMSCMRSFALSLLLRLTSSFQVPDGQSSMPCYHISLSRRTSDRVHFPQEKYHYQQEQDVENTRQTHNLQSAVGIALDMAWYDCPVIVGATMSLATTAHLVNQSSRANHEHIRSTKKLTCLVFHR